jgi:hypothetical protein
MSGEKIERSLVVGAKDEARGRALSLLGSMIGIAAKRNALPQLADARAAPR